MTGALPLRSETGDGSLARSAAAGDRQAFAEIYDRYADRLYDFCVGLLGDRDAAADCVHDAFCVAATDLGDLREPEKLRPWLYSIARHHAMRRLRRRHREVVSDAVPDIASDEIGPEIVVGQSELARLVADAAGGLSDRDRELLELSYRHGLDGPELAEALGVTLTNANTMVSRLRQTVDRCLGALLVARGARADSDACPELAAVLHGWDGQFTVLMRKRIARHIESCRVCAEDRSRRVNPVALLGGAPVFIPAPDWLRRRTLDDVQLTSVSSGAAGPPNRPKRIGTHIALLAGVPLLCLGAAITWFTPRNTPVSPVVDIGVDSTPSDRPTPPQNGVVNSPPSVTRPATAPTATITVTPVPTREAPAPPAVSPPGPVPQVSTPAPTPEVSRPVPGPGVSIPPAPEVTGPAPEVPAPPPAAKPDPQNPPPKPPPSPPDTNSDVTPPWPEFGPPWPQQGSNSDVTPPGTPKDPGVTPPNPEVGPVLPPLISPVVPTLQISPLPLPQIDGGGCIPDNGLTCPKASG